MTNHAAAAVIPDVEADIRWRDWQARGVDGSPKIRSAN